MDGGRKHAGNLELAILAFALTLTLQMPAANAQSVSAPPLVSGQEARKPAEQYYIDFRARLALSYGHSFVVFGRGTGPGRKISPNQIAGLHPFTSSSIPWFVGHVLPVPSETGASLGDTDPIYVSAHYLVRLNKAEYDRVVAYIRQLQANKTMWQAEAYNCNDFVADIARFMGLKVPSTMQFPKPFIEGIRDLNSGSHRPAAAATARHAAVTATAH